MKALICQDGETLEVLDVASATASELAVAITDHRELEAVCQAIRTNKETPHELD